MAEEWLTKGWPLKASPWETGEQAVFHRLVKPGSVVYDIGAHEGLHTALLSRLVGDRGSVYAFEPNPEKLRLLRLTLRSIPNVHLQPFALSDREGQGELYVPADNDSTANLEHKGHRVGRTFPVELKRLDDLNLPRPDFIKVDVEGHELKVFQGARGILDHEHAPYVLFEINPTMSTEVFAARSHLLSLGGPRYRISFVRADGTLHGEPESGRPFWNALAIPKARASEKVRAAGASHSSTAR